MQTTIPGRNQLDTYRIPQKRQFSITLAQLNAGAVTIIPAKADQKIQITGFVGKAIGGAFGGLTDIRLSDVFTDGVSANDLITIVAAQLTQNTVHAEPLTTGTHTTAAAFGAALGIGYGVQIRKTGGTATTATSFDGWIEYIVTNA